MVDTGYRDTRSQCEALVQGPAWRRTNNDLQCLHSAWPRESLANVALCSQHEEMAERYGELELTGDRMLTLEQKWTDDGRRRITLSAQIANITRLDRSRSAHLNPPIAKEEMLEQQRIAMKKMARVLGLDKTSRTTPSPRPVPPSDHPDAK